MNPASDTSFPSLRRLGFFLGLLLLMTYANSLHNGFMLDDDIEIFGEKGVGNRSPASLFLSRQGNFYRPIGHLPLWVAQRCFGNNVLGYHLLNLSGFFFVGVLFFSILARLLGDRKLALLSTALFAVHPVNAMLINYNSATIILTGLLLQQLSILFFLHWEEKRRNRFLAFSLAFFVLGLLSHETTLLVPIFLWGSLYFLRSDGFFLSLKACRWHILIAGVYVLLRLPFFQFNRMATGTWEAMAKPFVYLASLLELEGWYLAKLIFPKDLLFIWTSTPAAQQVALKATGWGLLALAIVWLLFFRWKKGIKPWALAIFVAGLAQLKLSAFTYYPRVGPVLEPHWFYLSSIGFFTGTAYLLLHVKQRISRVMWHGLIAGILALLAFATGTYNTRYRDQETFCRYWLSVNPKNLTPFYGLGKVYFDREDYPQAAYWFQKGIDTVGYNNIYVLTELGYSYYMVGKKASAEKFMNAAFTEDPDYSFVDHYVGVIYLREGNRDLALQSFRKAVELYPRLFGSEAELSRTRLVRGLDGEVLSLYREARAGRAAE